MGIRKFILDNVNKHERTACGDFTKKKKEKSQKNMNETWEAQSMYIFTPLFPKHHLKEKQALQQWQQNMKSNLMNSSQIPCIKEMFDRFSKNNA